MTTLEQQLCFSEDVWMYGRGIVGILPDDKPHDPPHELPDWLKSMNDEIRKDNGIKPRWG